MKGMDTTAEVSLLGEEEEQSPWDNVEDVTYEFRKNGEIKRWRDPDHTWR